MDRRLASLLNGIGKNPGRTIVCAHRGDRANAPENTLSAFQSAVDLGVEAVEFDIHLTADNKIVVIHDDDVARCSNGAEKIRRLRLGPLRRLDFGSWFNPRFRGERIPTLDEALELMRGKAIPVIEIKHDKEDYSPEIECLLLRTLDTHEMRRSVMVISFDGRILKRLHEKDGKLLLGALGRNDPVFLPKWVGGYHPPIDEISADHVRDAHEGRHWVFPWNADDQATMKRMMEVGVDIIGTDYPEILLRLLRDMEECAARPAAAT